MTHQWIDQGDAEDCSLQIMIDTAYHLLSQLQSCQLPGFELGLWRHVEEAAFRVHVGTLRMMKQVECFL